MKKTLSLSLLLLSTIITMNTCSAQVPSAENPPTAANSVMHQHPSREQMRKQFEQRLNLSEKQKEKAKIIHQQGREEMRPVIMQLKLKRQEIETVKLTRISEKMQKERIDQLNIEIKELEKQAQEIRKKNSQDFEKILNKKQKAELEKMKAEGRARFEQFHKPRPPFQGLGSPSLMLKPLIAPPPENNLWK